MLDQLSFSAVSDTNDEKLGLKRPISSKTQSGESERIAAFMDSLPTIEKE
jgi:hypothetical protein